MAVPSFALRRGASLDRLQYRPETWTGFLGGKQASVDAGTSTHRSDTVEPNRPHTITVASGRCTSDPSPVAIEAGNNPKMATMVVIRMGRGLELPSRWLVSAPYPVRGTR